MQLSGNRRKLEYDHTKLEGEITDADDASDLFCNSGCQTEVTSQEMTQMDIKLMQNIALLRVKLTLIWKQSASSKVN